MMPRIRVFMLIFMLLFFFMLNFAEAQSVSFSGARDGTSRYVRYQQPDFKNYYSGSYIRDYWPILAEEQKETCEGRQDMLIQVAPAGCQPSVVRSDLLAEQNVPVFCQIDALRMNPLVDIKKIRNVQFKGKYPPEVVGVGFHPARAALQTRNELLGSPFLNNIGYVVVVLRRQANESAQKNFLNFTLNAQVDYSADNVFGVGESSFYLAPVSEDMWKTQRNRQSFFKGRYFVRLDEADEQRARVSIYQGDRRVSTTTVTRGGRSERSIYLPGAYCQLGIKVQYDAYEPARPLAKLQVGEDIVEVGEGGSFGNRRCSLRRLAVQGEDAGSADISCGSESFTLRLSSRTFTLKDEVFIRGREGEGVFTIVSYDASALNYTLKSLNNSEVKVSYKLIYSKDTGGLTESEHGNEIEGYFKKMLEHYRMLVRDYPFEKEASSTELKNVESFGQSGLEHAIELAETIGKQQTAVELINLYLQVYPSAENSARFNDKLVRLYHIDASLSSGVATINGELTTISLLGLEQPARVSRARFSWKGQAFDVPLDGEHSLGNNKMTLDSLDKDTVKVTIICNDETPSTSSPTLSLRARTQGSSELRTAPACKELLRLESITLENHALIRLVPDARGPTLGTNFSVGIGIEQRALKLTPDKARERIENLNKTIAQWESLSKNLGNVVKTMKAACLATAGVLTVKNFVTGLDGAALARQKVMRAPNGWTEWCRGRVNANDDPSFRSIGECYKEMGAEIDKDVKTMTELIKADNTPIKAIDKEFTSGSGILGSYVDSEKAKNRFIETQLRSYGDKTINIGEGQEAVKIGDLTKKVGEGYALTSQEAKDLKLYSDLKARAGSGSSPVAGKLADEQLKRIALRVNERITSQEQRESLSDKLGSFGSFIYTPSIKDSIQGEWSGNSLTQEDINRFGLNNNNNNNPPVAVNTPAQVVSGANGRMYLALLKSTGGSNDYGFDKAFEFGDNGKVKGEPLNEIPNLKFSSFHKVSRTSCINKFAPDSAEIQFYETEPYKGLPAIVPFDLEQGWYVGTRQTIPAFGAIKAFQSSGRPASFWVCNVGKDKRPDFFVSGFDDDICQQFNLETGASLNKFSCLSESDTREIVDRAVRALEEAAHKRSQGTSSIMTIEGQSIKVGAPAVNIPGTQCQDFMSPKDCQILFNVCDPVICPSSRCDFGGKYPVADVIQSGIIGSALLCLPNFNEGVYIPVCLSGIKAGMDGYLSVLKSHKQCLEENIASGKYTGICDQISAIYMCEFFWRQAAPLANIALPKLIEFAYGQGAARGGGEYMTVQGAWDNAQASVNYFTQSYAVNSFKAFNLRSVEEAGGEFCKAFISVKGPKQFESLIEPDSPPQFHAWFSAIPYSDATVPATSQYKVFYHIFAGTDSGVSYSVYLKDPPQTSYYQSTATIQVASDYVPRGGYKTDTRDFTAPAGYQQLCVRVNDKEECGFKQVTTSFALNAIRDEFVNDELKRTDIKTEKDCVSGRVNPSAILNPNLQEAGQEAIDPAIYNRGVTRICATDNPGKATDPRRFIGVGLCDDERVKCWLDTQSVDRALTANNAGLRNSTLKDFEAMSLEQFRNVKDDDFLLGEGEKDKIAEIGKDVLKDREPPKLLGKEEAEALVQRAQNLFEQVILNPQKAELLFLQGAAYEAVTRGLWTKVKKEETKAPEAVSRGNGANSENTKAPVTPAADSGSSRYSLVAPSGTWNHDDALAAIEGFSDSSIKYGASSPDSERFTTFINSLFSDGVLTDAEYNDIKGKGFFNNVESVASTKEIILRSRALKGYHFEKEDSWDGFFYPHRIIYHIMNGREKTGLYLKRLPSLDKFPDESFDEVVYFTDKSKALSYKANAKTKERYPFVNISAANDVLVGEIKFDGKITFFDRQKAEKLSVDKAIINDLVGSTFDGYRFVPAESSGDDDGNPPAEVLREEDRPVPEDSGTGQIQPDENARLAELSSDERLVLEKEYTSTSDEKIYIWFNGTKTPLYLFNGQLFCEKCSFSSNEISINTVSGSINIGHIQNDRNVLKVVLNEMNPTDFVLNAPLPSFVRLNGATLESRADAWYVCPAPTPGQLACPPD